MPCRREEDEDYETAASGAEDYEEEGEEEESFLVLQQSVTVGGSGDVDRLVAQIGELLRLDAAHVSRPAPREPLARKQPSPLLPPPEPAPAPLQPSGPLQWPGNGAGAALSWASNVGAIAPLPSRVPSSPCVPGGAPSRSSTSALHICKRGLPQPLAGPCRRTWLRGAAHSRRQRHRHHHHHHHHHRHRHRHRGQPGLRAGGNDSHRLLQQLLLSGDLIKEAVRRLQRAVAAVTGAGSSATPDTSPSFVFAPGGGSDWGGRDSISLQPSTTSLL
ncbi:GSK-3-binding protein FRAT2 [Sarcophilus harrisii]|uniref:GSK-3-binding protein FRAT2 n=1 Tax=Sarcophilus harrisii TaxID=9305 RepID=UPI0013020657|nr:GSK-3-binding protein FRAT2 [Sarcophilus harrisii]